MPLPVFVINLDRRPDRWQAISARLNELGIAFERIQAIDANENLASENTDGMDPGGRACLASHCKAMRAFLATGADAALIFEDDAVIASDTATVLESVEWWPPGAGAVKLETTGAKPRILGAQLGQTPTGRALRRMYHGSGGAAGYLIGRTGAEAAMAARAEAPMAIDVMLFGPHRSLTRISHHSHDLRGAVGPAGQESRAARCGTSGKRLDAPCRPDSAALRVATGRPPAASRASTVVPATLFGPLLADRTSGRDAGRDCGEKSGLTARRLQPVQVFPAMVRQGRGPDDPSDIAPWYMARRHAARGQYDRFGSLRHKIAVQGMLAFGMIERVPVPFSDRSPKYGRLARNLVCY